MTAFKQALARIEENIQDPFEQEMIKALLYKHADDIVQLARIAQDMRNAHFSDRPCARAYDELMKKGDVDNER